MNMYLSKLGLLFLHGDLYYTRHQVPRAELCWLEMLQWIHGLEKFMFHEPGVFIQRLDFDFRKKYRATLGSIRAITLPSTSYVAIILY